VLSGGASAGASPVYIQSGASGAVNVMSLANAQDGAVFTRTISNKNYAIRRQSSTGYNAYQDNISSAFITKATSGTPPVSLFDGAYNSSGVASNIFENGAITVASAQCSGVVDPIVITNIILTFISSL